MRQSRKRREEKNSRDVDSLMRRHVGVTHKEMREWEVRNPDAFDDLEKLGGSLGHIEAPHDPVNSPSHYISDTGLEVVEVIEALAARNPHRAHSLKYLCRAGRKGGKAKHIEDLRKAHWWIDRELEKLEQEGEA